MAVGAELPEDMKLQYAQRLAQQNKATTPVALSNRGRRQ
jgi:hypothetical protein